MYERFLYTMIFFSEKFFIKKVNIQIFAFFSVFKIVDGNEVTTYFDN